MWFTFALACSMADKWGYDTGGEAPDHVDEVEEIDTDTDADTDTDTDTDSDTDSDTDADVPGPGDLAITEIMKNPDAVEDDFGEWFEVTNVGGRPFSLAGLEVQDNDGDGFVVESWTLAAGDTVVFGASVDTAENGGAAVDVDYDVDVFKLGNDDGAITLIFAGATLDAVLYDSTFPDEKGRSLTLSPDALHPDQNDDPGAWCAGATPYGLGDLGTPGAPNDTCDDTDTDTDTVTDSDGDGVDDADDCDPADPDVFPGATEVDNRVDDDCDGYVDERAPTLGDLVITEIMNNPDPTDDDTGEWFEIINAAGDPIALDGLLVTDAGGTGFTVVTDEALEPAQVCVFAVSSDTTLNGGVTPDYVYSVGDMRLANDDDELVLTVGGVLVDEVTYDGEFPDESGKSLSLDPTGYSATRNDEAERWCEGDGDYGTDGNQGTPGAVNDPCP